jgi:hypothetical protein
MRTLLMRVTFSVALVLLLALPAATTSARQPMPGPTLVVENPNPGDMLTVGKLEMQGVAFDPVATTGTGVDRVSVFLDNRDEGGWFLGDATLGQPTVMPAQTADAGWMLITPVLNGVGDGHTLFVYARSSATGEETVLTIPVTIGASTHNSAAPSEMVTPTGGDETPTPGTPEGAPADTSGM